ncbi:MAG: nitrogenase [Peptococcaceae bacterium]|nr:nitrogenase [Peptococcaceae bacterium]
MTRDIAVCMGENGRTASLHHAARVVVYRRRQGEWGVLKEKQVSLGQISGLPELRRKMAQLLDFLGECRVFVGLSITGVPCFELAKAGISLWEFAGEPPDFLERIFVEEEKVQSQRPAGEGAERPAAPVAVGEGRYQVSLLQIQEGNKGITSKQVLLPYLRKGDFDELEVLCSHVPPWLEAELAAGGLSGEIQKTGDNRFKIIISRGNCRRF